MDLRQLQKTMQDTQTDHARVVAALASIEGALPDLAEFKHQLSNANSHQAELIRAVARVATDLAGMREIVASSIVGLKADSMTIEKFMEHYQPRAEMMQAAIAAVPKIENEQHKIYKLLKAWSSRVREIEEVVAAVPRIQGEQVQTRNELADWNSRLNAACEMLAESMQTEDAPKERLPTLIVPTDP